MRREDQYEVRGDTAYVTLWYPRNDDATVKRIQLELMDVRAADDILIEYDFERDGWVIKQASVFQWGEDDDTNCDPDWQEVAFVQAWGRQKEGSNE